MQSHATPAASAATPADDGGPDAAPRTVTVVFCDVVGSTALGERLDPEEILGLLEPYYGVLEDELERHGGTVEKHIGDAVVALFVERAAAAPAPARAVAAALSAIQALAALPSEADDDAALHVRIGAASGEAVQVGAGELSWTEVMNRASTLQGGAEIDGVMVDDATRAACGELVDAVAGEPQTRKDGGAPIPAWHVLSVRAGAQLRGAVGGGEGGVGRTRERRRLTAVFVDLALPEELGDTPADEQARALEAHQTVVRDDLQRHGGTVEKYIGDSIVAFFGAPVATESDTERAVVAALEAVASVERLNGGGDGPPVAARAGIATGEVVVALDSRVADGRGMAWGDALNTAARVHAAAPKGGVLVESSTHDACRGVIEFEPVAPIRAKGKREPVAVWRALGMRIGAAERRERRAPFVGREQELATVADAYAAAVASRRAALVAVVAEPGVGKTRLITRACERMSGARVLWGRCLDYGEGMTYWPVSEIVKAAAGIRVNDPPDLVSSAVGTLLERLPTSDLDDLRAMATALASLVGAGVTPRQTYRVEGISQAELHWGLRRAFELLADERPLVLVFEDLHWAEPTLRQFLEELGAARAPIVVLATMRPESTPPARRTALIELEPLAADDSEAMLRELLGEDVDERSAERLLARAAGNPLFLEEMAQVLIEAAAAGAAPDVEALPSGSSLHSLIGARLDALDAEQREVTQSASVIGQSFWSGAVARVAARRESPDAALVTLERRDVVRAHAESSMAGEREWSFKHALMRDVAYARVPKARRVGLHTSMADWVAALPASGELVELSAFHLERACLLAAEVSRTDAEPPVARAVDALSRAGERAERREGLREAHRYYGRALALVPADDDDARTPLELRQAAALVALGELTTAGEQLEAVADRARRVPLPAVVCEALVKLGNVDMKQGRAQAAAEHLDEAHALARDLGDIRLQVRAAFEMSALRADFHGEVDPALDELAAGLALAERAGEVELRTEGHLRRGMLLFNAGRLIEADAELARCAESAQATGSIRDDARAAFMRALVKHYLGESRASEELGRQAEGWLERTADSYFRVQNLRLLGLHAFTRHDLHAAEELLRTALALAREGGGWLVYEVGELLVEVLAAGGRLSEARRLEVMSPDDGLPLEDTYIGGLVALAHGVVAGAEGSLRETIAHFDHAIELLRDSQFTIDRAEARVSYAEALHSFGLVEPARAQLVLARRAFLEMGALGLAEEADEGLARLREPLV